MFGWIVLVHQRVVGMVFLWVSIFEIIDENDVVIAGQYLDNAR
jgi:hypothetical protein